MLYMSGFEQKLPISKLGGGMPGSQPKLLGGGANTKSGSGVSGGSERSMTRMFLRHGAGRPSIIRQSGIIMPKTGLTPFRQIFTAGDFLGTTNEGPHSKLPKINQVNGIGPSMLFVNGGSITSGGAGFAGNPKYVYDSSDYTRFKNKTSQLKTYNDKGFGGSNNGSYTFLMNVR